MKIEDIVSKIKGSAIIANDRVYVTMDMISDYLISNNMSADQLDKLLNALEAENIVIEDNADKIVLNNVSEAELKEIDSIVAAFIDKVNLVNLNSLNDYSKNQLLNSFANLTNYISIKSREIYVNTKKPEIFGIREKGKINEQMILACYQHGVSLFEGRTSLVTASETVSQTTGMNKASAFMYIDDCRCMLEGRIFKRAISAKGIVCFFDSILKDYGKNYLEKAINATEQHLKYLHEKSGVPQSGNLEICKNIGS